MTRVQTTAFECDLCHTRAMSCDTTPPITWVSIYVKGVGMLDICDACLVKIMHNKQLHPSCSESNRYELIYKNEPYYYRASGAIHNSLEEARAYRMQREDPEQWKIVQLVEVPDA